jgi:hypothetical protein
MASHHLHSGGRYPVLRSIAIIYLYLGIAFALGGLAFGAYVLFAGWSNPIVPFSQGWGGHVMASLVVLAGTALTVISMLAVAEVLKLFIDIEHNSRIAGAGGGSTMSMTMSAGASENGGGARPNRITVLEGEETAEGALLRGH